MKHPVNRYELLNEVFMPFTTLSVPDISQLFPAGIRALQDVARRESEIRISTGSGQYTISHVPMLDGFTVEPERGGVTRQVIKA